jgi:murein DD-endopeptidase MepM/ murein hydrolase activator NlpD
MRRILALTGLLCLPLPLLAQRATVQWLQPPPRQGAFSYVVVRPPPGDSVKEVHGALDGVPLFFIPCDDGVFVALAGVPLDARDSVEVRAAVVQDGGGTDEVVARLPVTAAHFPSERLSVAPEFTRPPDPALAARIARESGLARAVSQQALATPRLWSDAFRAPRPGSVTSGYGIARVFNGAVQSRHLGVDFQGAVGDSVVATNRGVVALVGDFYYAGGIVYVNHGAGLVSAYLHLSQVLVAAGDTVVAGQLIGRVGRSGRVTGPHLHWAVKYGQQAMDGATLLKLPALETLTSATR